MKRDIIKEITATVGMIAVLLTFFVFALEFKGFILEREWIYAIAVASSAYAGIVSIFLTRRLERRRWQQNRVFLIYSRRDAKAAKLLADDLKGLGFNPWLDVEQVLPGQLWDKAVMQALEESTVALFLASKNTGRDKGYYVKEIKAALDIMKTKSESDSAVIPVRLEEEAAIPDELKGVQWVDLFEKEGQQQLQRGLKRLLPHGS